MIEKIESILRRAKIRKWPYVHLNSPYLVSGDCYNWNKIEKDILDVIRAAPQPVIEAAAEKCGTCSSDLIISDYYGKHCPMCEK